MDGEVQPKFGLMISLLLMNLSAIALFFYAPPAPREPPKKHAENVPLQDDLVAAGAVQTKIKDEKPMEAVVTSIRTNKVDGRSPRISLAEVKALPGKVELRVVTPKKTIETSDRPTEPPLAIALKKFVASTRTGVGIVFEGLKKGYTKRTRDSTSNDTAKMRKPTEGVTESARPMSKAVELLESTCDSPQNTKNLPSPARTLSYPTPFYNPDEEVNCLNFDAIPTEVVINALTRAQKRTNELIHVFSKRVVPAIERMNERVAEAIRLEKNLDSYTSTLINAINSVVCPDTSDEKNLGHQETRLGTSAVKKPKNSKTFSSELSVIRDPHVRDYIGSHSKGERSSVNKRPVFKTLAARCWHNRHRRVKHASRRGKPTRQDICEELQSKEEHVISEVGLPLDVLEQEERNETKSNEECDHIVNDEGEDIPTKMEEGSSVAFTEPSCQRTIGIEDVLALTSSLEQSSDQRIQSERDNFLSPLNSDPSMSSGIACRSCVVEHPKPEDSDRYIAQDESGNATGNLEQMECRENVGLSEDSIRSTPEEGVLCSSLSVVSSSIQNEIISVGVRAPSNTDQNVPRRSQTAKGFPEQGESNYPFSLRGNVGNTSELVNVFQRLNFREKEVAMESVCLLVLRIFEAWSESQRPISPLGLSRISLTSWPSTVDVTLSSRPCTAIYRSRMASDQERKSMDDRVPQDGATENKPPNAIGSDREASAEISRTLVDNVVEAAEIQIAEKSLMGLRTNILRNPPSKGEMPVNVLNSADRSGFGDINEPMNTMHEVRAAALMSTSHESVKVSKESSAATLYTGQPESSEDAFYECKSTFSAGTCESHELEVEDSSTVFLERIREEETSLPKHSVTDDHETPGSSFSIESWLTDSGEELTTAKETLYSDESFDVGCGTDDEAYPCSSQDLAAEEFKTEKCSKKKKWATKILNKFLKKKSKPSSLLDVASSKNASTSRSDIALKADEHYTDAKDGQ